MTGGGGVGVLAVTGANPRRKLMRERRETETTYTQIKYMYAKEQRFLQYVHLLRVGWAAKLLESMRDSDPYQEQKIQVKQGSNPSKSRRYPGLTKTLEVSFDWQQNHCCYYHRACFLEDPVENIQPEIQSDFLRPQQQHLRRVRSRQR